MVNVKRGLLSAAIAIVFVFFIAQGISTFYKEPKYEDYCNQTYYPRPIPMKDPVDPKMCEQVFRQNVQLEEACNREKGSVVYKPNDAGCSVAVECSKCNLAFDADLESYNKIVFIISLVLGIITLITGYILKENVAGTGLMGGGLLLVIYGTLRYWGQLQDYARFTLLGIALAILLYIAIKKLKQ